MTQPHYEHLELHTPEPDSDEAHYDAAAAYFDRVVATRPDPGLDEEFYDHRAEMLFVAVVIAVLAVIAAALLIGGGR